MKKFNTDKRYFCLLVQLEGWFLRLRSRHFSEKRSPTATDWTGFVTVGGRKVNGGNEKGGKRGDQWTQGQRGTRKGWKTWRPMDPGSTGGTKRVENVATDGPRVNGGNEKGGKRDDRWTQGQRGERKWWKTWRPMDPGSTEGTKRVENVATDGPRVNGGHDLDRFRDRRWTQRVSAGGASARGLGEWCGRPRFRSGRPSRRRWCPRCPGPARS